MDKLRLATLLLQQNIGSKKALVSNLPKPDLNLQKVVANQEIQMIGHWEEAYPTTLKALTYFPAMLFCKGDLTLLSDKYKRLCIVGTRQITEYGIQVLKRLLDFNGDNLNLVVISGLAYGIDAKVHSTCLARNIKTIAVVAGPIDKGFPEGNRKLYERLVEKGLVIAEFPPGRELFKGMFPMRNRIMGAMADLTLVVEAPKLSGALITARHAIDCGKDVAVVPGSIFSQNQEGVHELIKSGAGVVTSKQELFELLGLKYIDIATFQIYQKFAGYSGSEKLIKLIQKYGFLSAEVLINEIGFDPKEAVLMLTNLEMEGILWRANDNKYCLFRE